MAKGRFPQDFCGFSWFFSGKGPKMPFFAGRELENPRPARFAAEWAMLRGSRGV
jgi:hypothetical protein